MTSTRFVRFICLLLVVALLFNTVPPAAFADEPEQESTARESEDTSAGLTAEDSSPAQVVAEITENRTQYTKEFLLDSGLRVAAVYTEPVHYRDNGSWEEIDNTLRALPNGTYENTAGVWDVSFPRQLSGTSPISITMDGYTLSFLMTGQLRDREITQTRTAGTSLTAPETFSGQTAQVILEGKTQSFALSTVRQSRGAVQDIDRAQDMEDARYEEFVIEENTAALMYDNVYSNTDICYDLQANRVKESVIMQAYDSSLYGYRYTLHTGGMVPVLNGDNSISFLGKDSETVIMTMPAPFLVDDAQAYSCDVQVSLTGSGGSYTLTYLLPRDWLASEDRAWPVVLDPVVVADLKDKNTHDATVLSARPGESDNLRPTLQIGCSNNDRISRVYIKFVELPELTSADVIVNAQFSLLKIGSGTTAIPATVHKVTETWNVSGLCWNNMPDYDETVADYAVIEGPGRYYWDVTDIAREWYGGENTGLMLKAADDIENSGTANSFKEFYSSDYGGASADPWMVITYRNNNGLEGYWDYTTCALNRAGTGYVNDYTGNLVWVHQDLGFGGNRMPVTINHVYNANDSGEKLFGMGYGWRTNFNQRVYQWEENSNYYVWEDGDGTDHYFLKDSGNTYKDEDGLELTLTTGGTSTTTYVITDKYGNTSNFDSLGRLRSQKNNQQTQSTISVKYDSDHDLLIDYITDGVGRKYDFTYNSSNQLTSIAYLSNDTTAHATVTFTYSSSKLARITYDDDEYTAFTYVDNRSDSGTHLLSKVRDIDGYCCNYTYTSHAEGKPARVSGIFETETHNGVTNTGNSVTVKYAQNQTTFTDQSGNVLVKQFNSWGNTVATHDNQGRAQYGTYAKNDPDDSGKANQLKLASKMQNTVGNHIKDGDFTLETEWNNSSDKVTNAITGSQAYSGSKALKVTTNASAAGSKPYVYYSSYDLPKSKSGTFSAYVKSGAAEAFLEIYDGTKEIRSEYLPANSDWTRLQVTYTNSSDADATLRLRLRVCGQAVTYLDCVQFETAAGPSRFNLIGNGDFRNLGYWSETDGRVDSDNPAPAPELNDKIYKLAGDPTATNRIWQSVKVSGEKGDTYVVGGWAKAKSVPLGGDEDHDAGERRYSIIAKFKNTDGTEDFFYLDFNPYVDTWQFASQAIVAKKDYDSITVYLAYDYNANNAYFDGIQMFKERFGTSYTYDADGNVTKVVGPDGETTKYTYNDANDLIKEILPSGAELNYTYDQYHNPITAATREGVDYELEYDEFGNNVRVTAKYSGNTLTSTATYESEGNRLKTATDTAGNTTTYKYNYDTNVLTYVRYPEDSEDTQTNYTYDEMYRMVTAEADTDTGLSLSSTYTYTNDDVDTVTTASSVYGFTYGDFGLRTKVKVGSTTLAEYTYQDETKRLTALDYGNGDRVEYKYNKQGDVTRQTYEDGDTVRYLYGNSGELASVIDSSSGITQYYTYDLIDRLALYREVGEDHEASLRYSYNKSGNLTGMVETIDGRERTYAITYDDDNRVASYRKSYSKVIYDYDSYNRLDTRDIQHTNSGVTVYTEDYDYYVPGDGKRSTYVSEYKINSAGNADVTYKYTYDGNGNILSVSDGTNKTTYVYDSANQLIRENNQAAGKTTVWTYDNAGNIKSRKEYAYTTGTLGTQTDSVTYTYGNDNWGDLLTKYDGKTFSYDAIGNPLSDGTWTYTWEHGRELRQMTDGTNTWTFTYNADGLRTKRVKGNTAYEYVYLGGQLAKMTVDGIEMHFAYDAEGKPISIYYNQSVFYYYITNLQGDVVAIVDKDGDKIVSYTYDAWGNVLSVSGSKASTVGKYNPLRYRGYVYDTEIGLYYLQSRYYNPETGRFLNADGYVSTGQDITGYNMFAYCGNNPVNRVDPTGQFWKELWDVFTQTIQQASGYFAVAAGVSQVDTPVPGPADVASGILMIGGVLVCAGIATYTTITAPAPSISIPKVEEKTEAIVIPKEPDSPVIFPVDPNTFNPVGLVKVPRAGTKNGAFISWMDPITNTEVFRWDENPNYSNGPHYHIHGTGHYYPGMIVPEPYATIYFPVR